MMNIVLHKIPRYLLIYYEISFECTLNAIILKYIFDLGSNGTVKGVAIKGILQQKSNKEYKDFTID